MGKAGKKITNGASSIVKSVKANDLYDWSSNVAGSALNVMTAGLADPTMQAFNSAVDGKGLDLSGFGLEQFKKNTSLDILNAGTAGGVHLQEKAILDPRRTAERKGAQDAADAERAAAAATAALPKDPTVDEIARQRAARGGRRGTILTTPGQTLGGGASGAKALLGL